MRCTNGTFIAKYNKRLSYIWALLTILNIYNMKAILKINGVKEMSKKEQQTLRGGGPVDAFTFQCGDNICLTGRERCSNGQCVRL